ncbi:unnamed protein product [Candidula unifasciata]|uniref:Uncharacterized protein n=1 Tax=Candidula unifasciata TaxID=100452 RepID=A0A8S3ZI97_9EUPU|nr:unnamed protein product [Candidula unifasciata]
MNAEKRRKSRVQGGWAGAGSKRNNAIKPKQSVLASHASSQSPVTGIVAQRQVLASAQSHTAKLSESSIPQWTEQEIQVKPADRTIVKSGTYDISTEPSGMKYLRKQRSEVHGGVRAVQPRLTAWYSELPYTYAGITVEANTSEWPKCFGWHSVDEPIMGKNPSIASLSFGEERVFELDYTYSQVINIPLRSGSLLIEYHDTGARINVTFRVATPSHK